MEEAWELAAVSEDIANLSDAISLHNLLNELNKSPANSSLGDAAREHFNLDEHEIGRAIALVQDIAFRINSALLALRLPSRQANMIRAHFDPFKPLLDYSTFAKNLATLRNEWLKDAVVDNLLIIDPLLLGSGYSRTIIDRTDILSEDIPALINTVKSSKIDDALKTAINARLIQIEFSIRNFEVFGAEKVVDDVAAILGIVSLADEDPEADLEKSATKSIKSFAKKVFKAVRVSRQVSADMKFLNDGAGDIAGYLEDFTDHV